MGLYYIALCITLIPATVAVVKWKLMKPHQKWFAYLMWFIVFISFSGRLWTVVAEGSNLPFFHVYILVEALIVFQVFRLMLGNQNKGRIWLLLGTGFTALWIINVFTGKGWWDFPDYIHALEALIVLVLVFLWFRKMLKEKLVLRPERTFEFWMCAGMLIYFSGNFLMFLFSQFVLSAGREVFLAIWKVNAILNIILYSIYTVALLWVRKATK